jgi:hypothetical protein
MSSLRNIVKKFVSPMAAFALVVSGAAAVAVAAPASANGERTLTVHYQRTNADYAGWNMWTWNDVVTDGMKTFEQTPTSYGVVTTFPVKADGTNVGFLFRSTDDWATAVKDGGDAADRSVTLNPFGNTEVWLKEGSATVYEYNPDKRGIKIHYQRTGTDYAGWNLWTWGAFEGMKNFNGQTEYGVYWVGTIDGDASGMGFLFRSTDNWDTAVKDGGDAADRAATFNETGLTEVWLKQGNATTYTVNPDAVVVKKDQKVLGGTNRSVKVGKWITMPFQSTASIKLKWVTQTPKICKIVMGNKVMGVKAGLCKVKATNKGGELHNPAEAYRFVRINPKR